VKARDIEKAERIVMCLIGLAALVGVVGALALGSGL
jgi:hypothetical protein